MTKGVGALFPPLSTSLNSWGMFAAARSGTDPPPLFAGEPQWRPLAAFQCAQPGFLAGDVVAGDRHHALASGELDLHHHHGLFAERHFRRGEIELPHPHEALVVDALDLLAMRHEAVAPVF